MKPRGFSLKEIIFIMIITSLITSLTTGIIVYNQNKLSKNLTYQDLSNDKDINEFLSVYASLIDEYYESVDKKAMLESAISAMFNYLGEDYSTYLSKEETDALAERLLGEYKGIGIEMNRTTKEITGFIEGGAAKDSGLKIGDIITSVNNKEVKSAEEISSIIKEEKAGAKIELTVSRDGETYNFTVENKKLYVPAIEYKLVEDTIGVLQIKTFSNTLAEQIESALKNMESKGMKSLIIDVRNNTGGYLSAANDVASIFLEKGKVIYSLQEKDNTKEYKDETSSKKDYPIVILFNENSASASEILIAALKESYGATTVGKKSYGKGKVQQTHSLEDGSMVKYTSAKWLTPSGVCIDKEGITPEYIVEYDLNTEEDEQLNKAIELAK